MTELLKATPALIAASGARASGSVFAAPQPSGTPLIDRRARTSRFAFALAVAVAPLFFVSTAHAALGVCDAAPADNVEVEATAGTPGPTSYNTLGAAFAAINAGTHQGSISIEVCGSPTEAASAVLNASGAGASVYTAISIKPVGGVARTITGALAAPLIDLNGADNVTIDGVQTGGNTLTLANTSIAATADTSTIRFIGGATGNTVTRTSVQGSSLVPLATAGGTIEFSTDAVALTGNDNNTISFCDIGPAGTNLPIKAVFGLGTTTTLANYNSGVVIDHNNIFDFFGTGAVSVSGIHVLGGNDAWTISNNRLYQTAPRTFTAAARYAGITLNSTATGGAFTITGNTIGFGAANGTGTTTISGLANTFRGIDATTTNITTPTIYQNNVLSGINQTTAAGGTTTSSPFIGFVLGTSDGRYNAIGNQIGSLDGSSTIVVNSTTATASLLYGIFDFSFQSNTISNNSLGSITIQGTGTVTGFRGIYWNTGAGLTETVTGNTIGSATGPIVDLQVGNNAVYGMNGVSAAANLSGNTVSYLSANSTSNTTPIITVAGYIIGSTSTTVASTIARNSAHHLSNNAGASVNGGAIYGISAALPTTLAHVVERNLLHTFTVSASNTAYQLAGIVASTGTTTYRNNMVSLGLDASGNPITTGYLIIGLFDPTNATATTSQFYFNSVLISGAGVTAPGSNSYALYSNVVTNVRNFQDNILWNARGNAVAGGVAHVAIRIGATTAGLTSNYNDLFANGTDGVVGVFNAVVDPTLAAWQTATTQDALSLSVDPTFTAATNLHLLPGSPMNAMGTTIASVTDDFDGDARPASSPAIGADEPTFTGNLTIAPASFDFGNQTVATTSAPTTITLSNTGAISLNVTAVTPAAAPFAQSGGTCTAPPFTLAVGANCTLIYTFTPTVAGPANQAFTVTTTAPGATGFSLSGTGVPAVHTVTSSVGTPSGTVLPLGAQTVVDGASQPFTLTPAPGFHIVTTTGTCPGSLAGSTYTAGPITADCSVIANFAADALPPAASVTPNPMTFTVLAGASTSNPLNIANTGGGTLNWSITEATAIAPNRAATATPAAATPANSPMVQSRDGRVSAPVTPRANPAPSALVINEGFEDVPTLLSTGGWTTANHSNPLGAAAWGQCGGTAIPPAFDGVASSCALVNYTSTTGTGVISNWLIGPPVTFNAGSSGSFYTRTSTGAPFPDRLEVRLCTTGACTNIGTSETDVGDFTTVLRTVNPNLATGVDPTGVNGYPDTWAQFTLTGLPSTGTGRIAFRYFVTDGGPNGANSNIIGIDRFVVDNGGTTPGGCANPSDVPWLSESATSGAVAGGSSQNSTITVNAAALAAGAYSAHVCVATNDTANALVDVPVNVTVTPVTHVVTPSVGAGTGTITPSTPQTVNDGATQAFTLAPGAGFHIIATTGSCGGTLVGTTYTTNAVTADCSVIANFAANSAGTFPPDENFDEVTAPTLPGGWVSAHAGVGIDWVTSTTASDTAPNSAFAAEFPAVADETLTSPTFTPVAGQTLTFRHSYNLEVSATPPTTYDGAVLEISIDGGTTFQDILAAGGSFESGGYNKTVSTCCSNPLTGRQAWGGNSGGFVTTVVDLPAAAVGQPSQLRFRSGDDSSAVATAPNGWWIDTLHLGVLNPPSATVTPASLSFTAATNGTDAHTLTIANAAGSAPLTYTVATLASRPVLRPHVRGASKSERPVQLTAKDLLDLSTKSVSAPSLSGPIDTVLHAPAPWTPLSTTLFQYDDGTAEAAGGFGSTAAGTEKEAVYIDRFTATGALTIDSISILFRTQAANPGAFVGLQPNLVVYYDASASGDPANAVRVGADTLVTIAAEGAFQNYPVTFNIPGAGDVYVGFTDHWASSGTFSPFLRAGAVDTTPPSAGNSWISATTTAGTPTDLVNLANNDLTETSDAAFATGTNWMIRATGTIGGGTCTGAVVPWLTAAPASGSVNGGASATVTVTANPAAGSLAVGTYTAEVCVTTNDTAHALIAVPVTLTVTPPPLVPCSGGTDEVFCDGFEGAGGGTAGTYTDRTTFLTHVAAGFFENPFNDAVPGASPDLTYTQGSISYTVSSSIPEGQTGGGLYNDTGLISTNGSGAAIVVTFTGSPVTAVGGNFWATDVNVAPNGLDVLITLSDGTTETFTSTGPTDFRGFTTTAPIVSITIDAPNPSVPTDGSWSTMDNLIVGSNQ